MLNVPAHIFVRNHVDSMMQFRDVEKILLFSTCVLILIGCSGPDSEYLVDHFEGEYYYRGQPEIRIEFKEGRYRVFRGEQMFAGEYRYADDVTSRVYLQTIPSVASVIKSFEQADEINENTDFVSVGGATIEKRFFGSCLMVRMGEAFDEILLNKDHCT